MSFSSFWGQQYSRTHSGECNPRDTFANADIKMPRPLHQCSFIIAAGAEMLRPLAVLGLVMGRISPDTCQMCLNRNGCPPLTRCQPKCIQQQHKSDYSFEPALLYCAAFIATYKRLSSNKNNCLFSIELDCYVVLWFHLQSFISCCCCWLLCFKQHWTNRPLIGSGLWLELKEVVTVLFLVLWLIIPVQCRAGVVVWWSSVSTSAPEVCPSPLTSLSTLVTPYGFALMLVGILELAAHLSCSMFWFINVSLYLASVPFL